VHLFSCYQDKSKKKDERNVLTSIKKPQKESKHSRFSALPAKLPVYFYSRAGFFAAGALLARQSKSNTYLVTAYVGTAVSFIALLRHFV